MVLKEPALFALTEKIFRSLFDGFFFGGRVGRDSHAEVPKGGQ